MSFAAQLASVRGGTADSEGLAELARLALAEGVEEQALGLVSDAAARGRDARLWQWTALLQRSLDDRAAAVESFAEAARLDPGDPSIAHGRAHVAFEAGLDAVGLFEEALRLAPGKGDVLIGLAGAKFAAARGDEAADELEAVLARAPLWLQGHFQLAQLRSVLGERRHAARSLERALAAWPDEPVLWRALFDLHLSRQDFQALGHDAERAARAGRTDAFRADYKAIALAELGDQRADAAFAALPDASAATLRLWRIRHLLRTGRAREALPVIDAELAGERATAAWPYAACAWRFTGDPRSAWLERDGGLVAVMDLTGELPPLDRLAAHLRSLHVAKGEYLDQSVRGGTQTDGPLLSRIAPEIRALRRAIVGAVERYVAALPPHDPGHPLLGARRDRRVRFAGSWSVRLRDQGRHSNHTHQQGWISSALYVSLPERGPDEHAQAGWLTLGEPESGLGLPLGPARLVEPKPGRLVLFPSWMWHGTLPFAHGERLTVAFDVAPPR